MRLHLVLQPDSPETIAALVRLAEDQGFDAVWLPNIPSTRSAFITLACLARETTRIRIGPAALSPFEQHPIKIATDLLTLNELAHGRAQVAIGGGGGALIAMGLKDARTSNFPRMVRGVRECVEILRTAASGETLDFHGEMFRVLGCRADWAAAQPPPRIYVAANKPQMLRLAGTIADGVMLSDIDLPFIPETLAHVRHGLTHRDQREADFAINNLIAWHVKADREAAYAEARRMLWVRGIWDRSRIEPYLSAADCDLVQRSLSAWQNAYAEGSADIPGVPSHILDTLAQHLTLVGSVDDIDRLTVRLLQFRNAGVHEVSLRLYDDPADSIRVLAERVMPAVA